MQLVIGFLLAILISVLSYRVGALSKSGALAAILTGGLIFGLGGIPWAALLLTFFISSSLLSRLFKRKKASLGDKFAKGSQRDYGQVFANGGLGALFVMAFYFLPSGSWFWIAYIGCMAAVNADTWATELGVLSSKPPRLITNGKSVDRGTSGGVTLVGYFAIFGGAFLVGLIAAIFTQGIAAYLIFLFAICAGLVGSSFDSLLGAKWQAIYYCPQCQKETESHPLHRCGSPTHKIRGWNWLNNDLVNFLCSLAGAGTAIGLWFLLGH
jgi:uncharacterized protein (TIGR00297 family)